MKPNKCLSALASLSLLGLSSSIHATLSTGPGGQGVTVGNSSLIQTLDYSDTFTINLDRPVGSTPSATGYQVENSYGNPTRSWSNGQYVSPKTDLTAFNTPGVFGLTNTYPGGSGAGSDTGITESGMDAQTMVFEYNVRSSFTLQVDVVQTTDRVNLWFASSANPLASGRGVFFRPTGSGSFSIALYNGASEFNTGFTSGVLDDKWNNYAISLNGNNLSIYTNEVLRGVVDLSTAAGGAYLPNSTDKFVGYGSAEPNTVKWSDNFQIGAVPEPSTNVAIVIGGAALFVVCRKKIASRTSAGK